MKALVTGAAGFIGGRLSARLLQRGDQVVGVDAFTDYYDPGLKRAQVAALTGRDGFTLLEADLLDDDWQAALDDVEVVFHQAGQPGVRAGWATGFDVYEQRNVLATQRLLEALRQRRERDGDAAALKRLVYASSSSIYGDAMRQPTDEDVIPAPMSPYGVTKLAAEHLCGVYSRNFGVPCLSLRYFTVYGGGQRPDMALHRMIEATRRGGSFPRFGDGSQERDLTHVDDVVAANLAAADAEVAPGTVVNIAGGTQVTLARLIDLVGDVVGTPVPIEPRPGQPGDVARTSADTSRARQLLGWQPAIDLGDGIAEQVAWQQRRLP